MMDLERLIDQAASTLNRFRLDRKMALVVGGSRGLGQALKSYGRIDILVNSQGNVHLQPSIDFDTEAWQKVIDVNFKSVFLCCKHIGRVMLHQGKGKIINISSVRGFQGRAEDLAYAPSKGGVNQLTRSLAIEWGPKGINVNAIAPGLIWTPRTEAYEKAEPGRYDKILNRLPLRR